MKALVTGGAGFIGSHLVDALLKENYEVVVLDSLEPRVHPGGKAPFLNRDARFIQGDVRNKQDWSKSLEGVNVVFHQAAYQDYMPDYSRFFSTNVVGTALMFEMIRERRLEITKVVVASSQAVYGEGQYECEQHGTLRLAARSRQQMDQGEWELKCPFCQAPLRARLLEEDYVNPFNPYALSKYSEELAALRLGKLLDIPTVALRYSITQGPRQSLYNQYSGIARIFGTRLLAGEPLIVYEDGRQTRDFVHVKDVVAANLFVLRQSGANFQAFNVGSGVATSVLNYAGKLAQQLQKKPEILITGEYRVGDNRHSVSSIAKLQALGWSPRHGLDGILEDFSKWLTSNFQTLAPLPNAYQEMMTQGVVRKSG